MASHPHPPPQPQQQHFTLLHDKNMLAPASASSWCPTMDLLALATTDGQLSLSRLEWNKQGGERENKLWSVNPDTQVTALGWRPDGKVLVSGHLDGTVVLHHVEDGSVLHASKTHASAVTSVHWQTALESDASKSAFANQSAAARFTLPPRSTSAGGRDIGSSKTSSQSALVDHFDLPDRLTVLVSGDASGKICLSAFGVTPLGDADLTAVPGIGMENILPARSTASQKSQIVIQHATASPDLSRVLVGFGVVDDSTEASSSKIISSHVAIARVPLLAARSRELRDVAAHGAALAAANDATNELVTSCSSTWKCARLGFSKAITILAKRAREEQDANAGMKSLHDPALKEPLNPSLEERFVSLLAIGDVDDVLEQFLAHEFDANAARRVARAVDAAANEINRALLEKIGPAVETAMVRLAELRAYARWRERMQITGLSETALDAAVLSAERLSLACAAAARVATETASKFRAFFVLLARAQRSIAGESPEDGDEQNALPATSPALCRAFLDQGLDADELGAQLEALQGETGFSGKENDIFSGIADDDECAGLIASRESFLASVRGAAAAAGFAEAGDEENLPTLWRAAAELRGACATALEGPARAVSESFSWRPAFAVVAAGVDASGASMAPKASHGGFGNWSLAGDGGQGVGDDFFADQDGSRARSSSKFETVCFHAGASTPGGRHVVGVLALRDGVPEKALAVEAPAGQEVIDAAAYTKGRVLALCQPAGGANADAAAGPASVVMLDPSSILGGVGFVSLEDAGSMVQENTPGDIFQAAPPPGCAPVSSVVSVSFESGETEMGDDVSTALRRRTLPGLEATAPLAVGPRKGLAAVLVGSRRIVLLDLEEDECDEDDSDEDEDDE